MKAGKWKSLALCRERKRNQTLRNVSFLCLSFTMSFIME